MTLTTDTPAATSTETQADRLQALRARLLAAGWRVPTEPMTAEERAEMEAGYNDEKWDL